MRDIIISADERLIAAARRRAARERTTLDAQIRGCGLRSTPVRKGNLIPRKEKNKPSVR